MYLAGPGSPLTGMTHGVHTQDAPTTAWPSTLAARLFAIPPRWGWQSVDYPPPAPPPAPMLGPRPVWSDPPKPDTSQLRSGRAAAVTRLSVRLAIVALAVLLKENYWPEIESSVSSTDMPVVTGIGLIIVALIAFSTLRAAGAVASASRALHNFERPYLAFRAEEQARHQQAAAEWDRVVREHQQAVQQSKAKRPTGPLWYPVGPASEPSRVDVLGGDPQRHGWASLLVTAGASVLAAGQRITVLDLTGQDVGSGLISVAEARALPTHRVDLPMDGARINFLGSMARRDLPECLAYAFTGRRETSSDLRIERALISEVLQKVLDCLDGEVTFARLAAGVQVLRRTAPAEVLSSEEVNRLAQYVGDIGGDEWTGKQLRFLTSQLGLLSGMAPGGAGTQLLWSGASVSVIATAGGRDDRKELLDRLVSQLAQHALQDGGRFTGFLVVAGADHLGTATLERLSDHARQAGVRLMLMIDQPQGDAEKLAGTGGAVCVMKMYNHRDAKMAAEFIGRDHKFVVSGFTAQVGKSFSDGGGDNFAASSSGSTTNKVGWIHESGRKNGISESRGHTWTDSRNWSVNDSLSDSTTTTRVYEFNLSPEQILGLPETAFVMVDNSGQGRKVVLADCFPGICLLDRVSPTPAPATV